jgi:tetratricopeptide (TPR) repeat protein
MTAELTGPLSPGAIELFFSYAREDESLRNDLAVALAGLRRQGLISEWYDRKITPGQEFDREIDSHIESARVILLLVSADFLNSEYCWGNEVARAIERHSSGDARVIPIILRPTDWKSAPFARLQALPRDARPITAWDNKDAALEDIAIGIRKAITDLISEGLQAAPTRPAPIEKELGPVPPLLSFPAPSNEQEAAERIRSGLFSSAEVDDLTSRVLQALDRGGPSAAREVIEDYLADVVNASIGGIRTAAALAGRLGLHDLAARLYLEASYKAPESPDLRRNLVVALSTFDQDDLALPFARRLVAENPDNEDYVELLAQVLQSAGHNVEAWAFTLRELERFPSSTYLLQYALASGQEAAGSREELDALAANFLSQDFAGITDGESRRARGHSLYASHLARLDRDKESVEHFEQAIQLGDSSPIMRGNYAVELGALGQDEEAERQFRIGMQDADNLTDYSRIKRQYVMFLVSRGRASEASQAQRETWEGVARSDDKVDSPGAPA